LNLRPFFFWLHLSTGLAAGLIIAVMAATGTTLAFEKEIINGLEREVRHPTIPPAAIRLSLDEILQRVRANPTTPRLATIAVPSDPTLALVATAGRNETYFINPSTAEITPAPAIRARAFFRAVEAWHRNLALTGERRVWGKSINDACNVGFLFLALSGLYLWWPRGGFVRGWKIGARFNFKLRGKARDWNWHNTIGFWLAPILIGLTATALPLSYRWAGDLIYTVTGTSAAPNGESPATRGKPQKVATTNVGTAKPNYQNLLIAAEHEVPDWTLITLRFAGGERAEPAQPPPFKRSIDFPTNVRTEKTASQAKQNRPGDSGAGSRRNDLVNFTIRAASAWPRTATITLVYDAQSAELLKRENFADQNLGRRVRSWTRFLHTGEAVGWPGQLLAALGCVGAMFLLVTGISLAVRRFFAKQR
jgi:uncharacterized iron-regulated membrane protein